MAYSFGDVFVVAQLPIAWVKNGFLFDIFSNIVGQYLKVSLIY